MKPTKKTLLKTLFISALAGLSVLGGCKKNQSNNVPQKGNNKGIFVQEVWEKHLDIERNTTFSSKQRD
jgi:hypothetical protein